MFENVNDELAKLIVRLDDKLRDFSDDVRDIVYENKKIRRSEEDRLVNFIQRIYDICEEIAVIIDKPEDSKVVKRISTAAGKIMTLIGKKYQGTYLEDGGAVAAEKKTYVSIAPKGTSPGHG